MSSEPSSAFLEGAGVPVGLSEIERTLDDLWGPAAEKAGGPEVDQPAVTRVVLANVVIVDLQGPDPGLEETVRAISTHYPSRILVLGPSGKPGRGVQAEVSAKCHLPAADRPQVCSEQIVLKSDQDAADLLPAAVRSLRLPDLHSILWWRDRDDDTSARTLLEPLSVGATRLIVDRPDIEPPSAILDPNRRPMPRDLVWFGLTPWRDLIAQFFDPPALGDLNRIAAVRVIASAPAVPRSALWLVAWLAAQLDWSLERARSSRACVEAAFQAPGQTIPARIEAQPHPDGEAAPPRLEAVELDLADGDRTHRVSRASPEALEVVTLRKSEAEPPKPRRLAGADPVIPRLVEVALGTDRNDPPYRKALPILLRLARGRS